jgi:hypothetical protein
MYFTTDIVLLVLHLFSMLTCPPAPGPAPTTDNTIRKLLSQTYHAAVKLISLIFIMWKQTAKQLHFTLSLLCSEEQMDQYSFTTPGPPFIAARQAEKGQNGLFAAALAAVAATTAGWPLPYKHTISAKTGRWLCFINRVRFALVTLWRHSKQLCR